MLNILTKQIKPLSPYSIDFLHFWITSPVVTVKTEQGLIVNILIHLRRVLDLFCVSSGFLTLASMYVK